MSTCDHAVALAQLRAQLTEMAADAAIRLPAGQQQPGLAATSCPDCGAPLTLWRRLHGARIREGEPPAVCCRCVEPALLAGQRVSHGYCARHAEEEHAMLCVGGNA